MADQHLTLDQIRRAVVSVLATLAVLLLGLGLFLPIATVESGESYRAQESALTLWQEAVDDGFTDGGGAGTVTWGVVLLVITLAALVGVWTAALMFGGGIGPTGARVARVAGAVLLVGATWMAFRAGRLAELAQEWNDPRDSVVTTGAGVWWLLAGAVVLAAATLPPSVQRLWRAEERRPTG